MNSAAANPATSPTTPAAERDEHRGPVDSEIEEAVEQRLQLSEGLGVLAGRNGHRVPSDSEAIERRRQTREVRIADHGVGDHHGAASVDDGSEHVVGRLQQPLRR